MRRSLTGELMPYVMKSFTPERSHSCAIFAAEGSSQRLTCSITFTEARITRPSVTVLQSGTHQTPKFVIWDAAVLVMIMMREVDPLKSSCYIEWGLCGRVYWDGWWLMRHIIAAVSQC